MLERVARVLVHGIARVLASGLARCFFDCPLNACVRCSHPRPLLTFFLCACLPANQILDMFLVEGWPLLFKMSLGVLLEMRPLLEVCALADYRSDH